jgi:hypothetical protein
MMTIRPVQPNIVPKHNGQMLFSIQVIVVEVQEHFRSIGSWDSTEMDRMIRGAYVGKLHPGRVSSRYDDDQAGSASTPKQDLWRRIRGKILNRERHQARRLIQLLATIAPRRPRVVESVLERS